MREAKSNSNNFIQNPVNEKICGYWLKWKEYYSNKLAELSLYLDE